MSETTSTSGIKVALALLVFFVVLALYLFMNSSYFFADKLEWTGLLFLDEQQLESQTDFEPLNVLRLDAGALVRQIGEHPWVESAQIRWKWPNRIQVVVTERTPVAQLRTEDQLLVLDRQGSLLAPPPGLVVEVLPVVEAIDTNSPQQLKSAARVLSQLPASIASQIVKWNMQTRSFTSTSGTSIMIGELEELELKYSLLDLILEDLREQGVSTSVIDLRVPKNPVVTTL